MEQDINVTPQKVFLDLIMAEYGLDVPKLLAIGIEETLTVNFHETGVDNGLSRQLNEYKASFNADDIDYERMAKGILKDYFQGQALRH